MNGWLIGNFYITTKTEGDIVEWSFEDHKSGETIHGESPAVTAHVDIFDALKAAEDKAMTAQKPRRKNRI